MTEGTECKFLDKLHLSEALPTKAAVYIPPDPLHIQPVLKEYNLRTEIFLMNKKSSWGYFLQVETNELAPCLTLRGFPWEG